MSSTLQASQAPASEVSKTTDAHGDPYEPKLFSEPEAAEFLGYFSCVSIANLRKAKILNPEFAKDRDGQWADHYHLPDLAGIKPCLETIKRLYADGYAEPVDGHLYVLQQTPQSDNEGPSHSIVDLGVKRGLIYTLKMASKEFKIPRCRLMAAISKGKLAAIHVYGGNVLVLFEKDLAKFKKETKLTRGIDRTKFLTTSELCVKVGATGITQKCEVSECARLWAKMGLLLKKEIRGGQYGRVPSKWSAQNGKPIVIECMEIMKHFEQELYEGEKFDELWKEDLDKYAVATRKLIGIGSTGLAAKDLHAELEKRGITGKRFLRVVRLAGASLVHPRIDGPWIYVLKRTGLAPIRRRQPIGKTSAFLLNLLESGPLLRDVIKCEAEKRHIKLSTLGKAFKKLKCKRSYAQERASNKLHLNGGTWAFWLLPDQDPPTKEEARRLIAEHLKTKARAEIDQTPATPTEAPTVAPPIAEPEIGSGKPQPAGQRNGERKTPIADPPPSQHTKEVPNKKKRRGRQTGWRDPNAEQRKKEMLDAWDRGDYGDNKSAAAEAHGFDRSNGTKVINKHEHLKPRK